MEVTKDKAALPSICAEQPLPAPAQRGEDEQGEAPCVLLWGLAEAGLQGLTRVEEVPLLALSCLVAELQGRRKWG